ncbi:MAG: GGDEF domain-containing protein [Gammaproteobacteria bacterium]|nr:GGDEF domain-containing protein [Gammaproteobacteria bacterium]
MTTGQSPTTDDSGSPPTAAAGESALHWFVPRFRDPGREQAFQLACLSDTRMALFLLSIGGVCAALATMHGAWTHLPHDQPGYPLGQAIRLVLLAGSIAAMLIALRAAHPATLLWTTSVVLVFGLLTLALRMATPPAPDVGLLEALLHVNRDGLTVIMVVAVAVLTLMIGHFTINAAIFALALAGFLVIANTWSDGLASAVSLTYGFSTAFVFVLALSQGIQRTRRHIYLARQQLQEANAQLHEIAIRDYLTGCFNRRHFYTLAEPELARAHRHGTPLSLLMFDLDHFKQVNDNYGHACGDAVLCQTVGVIQGRLRISDALARIGGEEFVVLLPETEFEQANQLAERLRQAIAEHPFEHAGRRLKVTASWGVASARPDDASIDILLDRADRGLYLAKKSGRNRVCVEATETLPDAG